MSYDIWQTADKTVMHNINVYTWNSLYDKIYSLEYTMHTIDLVWIFVQHKCKGKVLPYSLLSIGPGSDPGVQAVSPQVTWSHPPGGRLPLLSDRPAVTFPAEKRHHPSAGTKLYCLVTEAHACEQLAQDCYLEADRPRFEPATFRPHKPLFNIAS